MNRELQRHYSCRLSLRKVLVPLCVFIPLFDVCHTWGLFVCRVSVSVSEARPEDP